MTGISNLTWPRARAGDALSALAARAGLEPKQAELGAPNAHLDSWLAEAACFLGVELESVEAPYAQVTAMLGSSAPALIKVCPDGDLIALMSTSRSRASVLTPDGERRSVALSELALSLTAPHAAPIVEELSALADRVDLTGSRRARAVSALTTARLRFTQIGGVYSLRLSPEAPLRRHARKGALWPRMLLIAAAHALSYALGLASWWAIGRGALAGRLDAGFLLAWAALLSTAAIVRASGLWWMGGTAIDASVILKQRLLAGALRISPDVLRAEGVGSSLGRVLEANAVERLASDGGFLALFALIELAAAAVVLGAGAGGAVHLSLFGATLLVAALLLRRYLVQRRAWTRQRLGLTHDLVEAMVGHATRLAQQPHDERHLREDRALTAYASASGELDHTLASLQALLPRGWLVLAVLGLVPAVVGGAASSAQLALALGGAVLAFAALHSLVEGLTRLADAAIAWEAVAPLVHAGGQAPAVAPPGLALSQPSSAAPVASLRGVVLRPPRRALPVLAGCDLTIERGARLLLEGASGAGKSTLGAVLSGLRSADAGLVLAGGLDRASLGESGWRRRVACAPQFHDNHLFSGPLAFNLLVGRTWPPSAADLEEASALCTELGLGPVIARMPAGLLEMVGETGWQLSHGEKSRVYLARALLQGAELVVLDESLAALDPGTLEIAIRCIERRASAALVVAHP